jgi:hypothetical protein
VIELIRRDQALAAPQDWLEEIGSQEPIDLGEPAAELIRAARKERLGGADQRLASACAGDVAVTLVPTGAERARRPRPRSGCGPGESVPTASGGGAARARTPTRTAVTTAG